MARGMEDDMNVMMRVFRGTLGMSAPPPKSSLAEPSAGAGGGRSASLEVTDCEVLSSSVGH
jgi:hypothetical protein